MKNKLQHPDFEFPSIRFENFHANICSFCDGLSCCEIIIYFGKHPDPDRELCNYAYYPIYFCKSHARYLVDRVEAKILSSKSTENTKRRERQDFRWRLRSKFHEKDRAVAKKKANAVARVLLAIQEDE